MTVWFTIGFDRLFYSFKTPTKSCCVIQVQGLCQMFLGSVRGKDQTSPFQKKKKSIEREPSEMYYFLCGDCLNKLLLYKVVLRNFFFSALKRNLIRYASKSLRKCCCVCVCVSVWIYVCLTLSEMRCPSVGCL